MRALTGHNGGSAARNTAGQARTKPYRVREFADEYDISDQTIYRDIESGLLRALRFGRGRGTLRIPVDAAVAYLAELESRAATRPDEAINATAGAA